MILCERLALSGRDMSEDKLGVVPRMTGCVETAAGFVDCIVLTCNESWHGQDKQTSG